MFYSSDTCFIAFLTRKFSSDIIHTIIINIFFFISPFSNKLNYILLTNISGCCCEYSRTNLFSGNLVPERKALDKVTDFCKTAPILCITSLFHVLTGLLPAERNSALGRHNP